MTFQPWTMPWPVWSSSAIFFGVSRVRALVVGLGSIGRRHVRNLKQLEPEAEIIVWRRPHSGNDLGDTAPLVDGVVTSREEALTLGADVALITNPAPFHVPCAIDLARSGTHIFVEKPLSHTLEGVDALLDDCRARALVLMVGYNFRFYKPLQLARQALADGRIGPLVSIRAEVGQYLADWRPGTDYREGVSARKDLGGGVLLELSHELDYVGWLGGEVESVYAQTGRLSDLDIDVEDTAEVVLRFACGAIGSVHLDMVQRPTTRCCRIVGTQGTLTWDGMSHQVRLYSPTTDSWRDIHPAGDMDRNEMYLEELRHFLECVRHQRQPVVTGQDGRRVLEISIGAKRSSGEMRAVALSPVQPER